MQICQLRICVLQPGQMASKTGPQVATDCTAASLLVARFGQVFVWRIGWPHQPAGSAHRSQIIFVRDSTIEAHLIILAMSPSMRPGEPMGAEPCQEPLEELDCHPAFNPCRGEFARHLCALRTQTNTQCLSPASHLGSLCLRRWAMSSLITCSKRPVPVWPIPSC
jgi:hypothetical protein